MSIASFSLSSNHAWKKPHWTSGLQDYNLPLCKPSCSFLSREDPSIEMFQGVFTNNNEVRHSLVSSSKRRILPDIDLFCLMDYPAQTFYTLYFLSVMYTGESAPQMGKHEHSHMHSYRHTHILRHIGTHTHKYMYVRGRKRG